MSTEAERQAANVVAPTQSNTGGVGVTILAATTTAANTAVPDALFNRYVYLQPVGDAIWVNFGTAAAPDVDKSKTGGATFTLGTDEQNAILLPDGQRFAVRLSKSQHAYIKWQANAANSSLLVWPTTQKGRF